MERIARFMETFWLVLAVASAAWAIYALSVHGWEQGRIWLLFPAVCTAMWGWRRFMRSRIGKWAERERAAKQGRGGKR